MSSKKDILDTLEQKFDNYAEKKTGLPKKDFGQPQPNVPSSKEVGKHLISSAEKQIEDFIGGKPTH